MITTYFVIYRDEEGDFCVEQLGEDTVLKRLNPDGFGLGYYGHPKLLDKVPDLWDWPLDSLLVIKGEIAVPKPVEVVKQYSFY